MKIRVGEFVYTSFGLDSGHAATVNGCFRFGFELGRTHRHRDCAGNWLPCRRDGAFFESERCACPDLHLLIEVESGRSEVDPIGGSGRGN